MKHFSESEVKYLAGLLDADGCLSFNFVDGKLYMEMSLSASESIDHNGYIDTLAERIGNLAICKYPDKPNWSNSHQWIVTSRRDLNLIIPRVVGHMVIKGAHWKRMFDKYTELKGMNVSKEELQEFSSSSRKETGSIKPKIHPTWAWVSGYLDGNGCYIQKKHNGKNTIRIDAVSNIDDRVGIDLLVKAFGGTLFLEDDYLRWRRAAGKRSTSFAIPFLKKVHKHSRLKKHKIEGMLQFHKSAATTK
jgi:hypothetical protein